MLLMWHRVASLLGRTVAELKHEITFNEFLQWCEFYNLEPWGFWSDQMHAALIASTVDNCQTVYKRRTKFSSIQDYMVSLDDKDKVNPTGKIPSPKQLVRMFKSVSPDKKIKKVTGDKVEYI